jgi:hypothetical protein
MTQTNAQEVALFTPVEPAELTAIDGGMMAVELLPSNPPPDGPPWRTDPPFPEPEPTKPVYLR